VGKSLLIVPLHSHNAKSLKALFFSADYQISYLAANYGVVAPFCAELTTPKLAWVVGNASSGQVCNPGRGNLTWPVLWRMLFSRGFSFVNK
jgi:hypothetical protein